MAQETRDKPWLHDCIGTAGPDPVAIAKSIKVCPICGKKQP